MKKRSSFLQPPPVQQSQSPTDIGNLISLPSDDDVRRQRSNELLSLHYDPNALGT